MKIKVTSNKIIIETDKNYLSLNNLKDVERVKDACTKWMDIKCLTNRDQCTRCRMYMDDDEVQPGTNYCKDCYRRNKPEDNPNRD